MQPHEQRVIDEKTELDEKLAKLKAFFTNPIFTKLTIMDQNLLIAQSNIMDQYSSILKQRIEIFPK